MQVHALFVIDSITEHKDYGPGKRKTIKASPVNPYMGSGYEKYAEEIRKFWEATPSGSLEIAVANANAVKEFEVGKLYRVTFEKIED